MAIHISYNFLAFMFGFLGNIVGIMVYLAPLVTFYAIYYKEQSTKLYDVIPYSVTLFSAALLLYYAFLKGNGALLPLITINSFAGVMEVIYLILFYFFSNSKRTRITIALLVVFFNTLAYFAILTWTSFVSPLHKLKVVGWICASFSVLVYAAPLRVMGKVIMTKSVKSISLPLSICLTLSAIFWFFYGFFLKDYFIAAPNVLGFLLGVAQIMLYYMYKNSNSGADKEKSMGSESGENIEESTIDEEIMEMIEIAKANIVARRMQLESSQQSLNLHNNAIIGNHAVQDSAEIQEEIVEIPDEPRNLTFTHSYSVARF